jgi:peptide deformylase
VSEILELSKLRIIHYPDPRLRRVCAPVTRFDEQLASLAQRMSELMETGKGVGLAAAQAGVNQRVILVNTTGRPEDTQAYVNPVLRDLRGSLEAEEGCLSLPDINVQVRRAQHCHVTAQDLAGRPVSLEVAELEARVFQHEIDHLNGVLIIDRMGPGDRIATRKTLRALEDQFKSNPGR